MQLKNNSSTFKIDSDSYSTNKEIGRYCCDFLLSIGPDCRCALHLKGTFLRDFSAPLDWMTGYSLDTVLHLFRTKFVDFFEEYKIDKTKNGSRGMYWVDDIKNHIVSIHHFPVDMDIDYAHQVFLQKMCDRVKRLEDKLQNANSVVLLAHRGGLQQDLVWFIKSFSKIYPHLKIRLLNMRNDERISYDTYTQKIVFDDGNLSYVEYLFNDTGNGSHPTLGNEVIWKKVLSGYITKNLVLQKNKWISYMKNYTLLIIYGAGKRCHDLLSLVSSFDISVDGIAVSSIQGNPEEINGVKGRLYSEYPKDAVMIISLKSEEERLNIKNILQLQGYKNIKIWNGNNLNLEEF